MKKLLFSLSLLAMFLTPTLSMAIDRCGLICKHKAAPFYADCKSEFTKCTEDQGRNLSSCHEKMYTCMKQAQEFQLSCVDLCMRGEDYTFPL